MKYSTLLCCVFAVAIAEKQLKLEDIERDNLASEREVKQQKQAPKYSQPYNPPSYKTPSHSQSGTYGFAPIKPSIGKHEPIRSHQSGPIQQEIQQGPVQEQLQYVPAQYYYQQQQQQPQYPLTHQYQQYQQYENVPYVIDNQINSPQYVYVQPYSAPSNNVQMVVDSKGQVKYYMYLPVQYVKEDQTGPTIQYASNSDTPYSNVGPQIFTQEPDYHQAPNTESQYITQPQLPPEPHAQAGPQVNFIPIEKGQYSSKGEPQSLLDSYVPSIVQYQYYKQQQQQAQNGLGNLIKKSASKPSQKAYNSHPVYVPSSSSELSYSVQLPTIYSKGYSAVKANTK